MKKLYVVRDRLAGEILANSLLVAAHDAPAVRAFSEAVANDKSLIAKHPKDFELLALCFITEDGQLVAAPHAASISEKGEVTVPPVVVITGDACKAMQDQS